MDSGATEVTLAGCEAVAPPVQKIGAPPRFSDKVKAIIPITISGPSNDLGVTIWVDKGGQVTDVKFKERITSSQQKEGTLDFSDRELWEPRRP